MPKQQKTSLLHRIGILATGNELIEGDIVNTNSQEIAHALVEHNLVIGFHVTVSDHEVDMENALKFLLKHHNIIITSGGLGPTSDDRTRYAISKVLKKELVFDEISWQNIRARILQRVGHEAHPCNRQQTLFPDGAEIIPNKNGSAAGCIIKHNKKIIFMLPGPPQECLPMFTEVVLPKLLDNKLIHQQIKLKWILKGTVESEFAALLDEAVKPYPATTGYRVNYPYLEVKIYTEQHSEWDAMMRAIEKIINPYLAKTDHKS